MTSCHNRQRLKLHNLRDPSASVRSFIRQASALWIAFHATRDTRCHLPSRDDLRRCKAARNAPELRDTASFVDHRSFCPTWTCTAHVPCYVVLFLLRIALRYLIIGTRVHSDKPDRPDIRPTHSLHLHQATPLITAQPREHPTPDRVHCQQATTPS